MSAFMLFGTALTIALVLALSLLVGDALHREHVDDDARMRRRARVFRLPTVISRNYVGIERRRVPRAANDDVRHAA
ncbi:hypothetical protein [Cognatilysobacter terrigena]|uniref:hypothetical protein n=1 Tax=Cognatilysobacter terrigena TaxID=2488749 RepID=UPI00105F4AF6|nr:hypothetical protein [Lysobacter terrigena]